MRKTCSIIVSGLYFLCVFFLGRKLSGQFCMVNFLNSQKRNSSLQKRGVQRYLSGKRMQMQTKSINKHVLFFFVWISPFSLRSLFSQIRKYMFKKNAVPNWILRLKMWKFRGKKRSTTQEEKAAPHQRRLGK